MFNRSRKVICHECGMATAWQGAPELVDALHCRHCNAFIITHEDYLRGMMRQEVSRIMLRYVNPDSAHELGLLKNALSRHEALGLNR